MVDQRIGDSSHDLLLALAGRVDDDLLAWCRELVAVDEDARAVELVCGTLAADRTPLPPAVRDALVAAALSARTDVDADTALPPAADAEVPHLFAADLPVVDELAAAVATLPARQVAGCRLHLTARTTPAGAAPGPLPQPVVVAEVGPDDSRPLDVLAYQLAIACARAGVPAAVEVVVAGAVLPAYQRAALLAARADVGDARRVPAGPATPGRRPAAEPAGPPVVGPPASASGGAERPAQPPAAGRSTAAPADRVHDEPVPDGAEVRADARPASSGGLRSLAERMAAWDTLDAARSRDEPPAAPGDVPAGPARRAGAEARPADAATAGGPEVPATGDRPLPARSAGRAAEGPGVSGRPETGAAARQAGAEGGADRPAAPARTAADRPAGPATERPVGAGRTDATPRPAAADPSAGAATGAAAGGRPADAPAALTTAPGEAPGAAGATGVGGVARTRDAAPAASAGDAAVRVAATAGPAGAGSAAAPSAAGAARAVDDPAASGAARRPAGDRSVADRPAADRPVAGRAVAAGRPGADRPGADQPEADRPGAARPAADRPAADRPAVDRPAADPTPAGRPVADRPAAGPPAVDRPAAERPTGDRPPATPAGGSTPAAAERPSTRTAAERPAARPAAAHALIEPGDRPADRPGDGVAAASTGGTPRSGDHPDRAPFGRVDSGPVSFDPVSPDPTAAASEDERPRWPASGGLVLPRRRPGVPAPDGEPAPTERAARPTSLRSFLRPVPEPAGRSSAPPEPVEELPREAVVRPLRPAPPDRPAAAPVVDPMTDTRPDLAELSHPEPVIDEDDPLGLGRLPLAPEDSTDPWASDWLGGGWASRSGPSAGSPPSDGPAPSAAPEPVPVPPPGAVDRSAPLLPPEAAARLDDDDRELLARLQAELGTGGRPAGVAPNGHGPTPPDLAG